MAGKPISKSKNPGLVKLVAKKPELAKKFGYNPKRVVAKKGGMVDKRSPFMGGGIAYAGGGKAMPRVKRAGGGPGLYANIAAKRERIKAGSGETMRKKGAKGAPTAANFTRAAQTAKS